MEKLLFMFIWLQILTSLASRSRVEKVSPGTRPICNLSLEVAQNSHDVSVLLALKQFFDGGYIKPKYNVNVLDDCLHSRSVNRFIFRSPLDTLIQFFSDYPLKTRKMLDFSD